MKTLLLLLVCACPLAATAAEADQVSATWQTHEIDFSFMGFTSTYSCDGLADKVKLLLLAVGARPDTTVKPDGCPRMDRPDPFSRVHISFSTLAPAADPAAPTAAIPGVWRKVNLQQSRPFQLDAGDCELVEQLKREVFTKFTTRNMGSGPFCQPHSIVVGQPALSFEVLAPPAAPGKGKGKGAAAAPG